MLGDLIPDAASAAPAPTADGDPSERAELIDGIKADLLEIGSVLPEVEKAEAPGANSPEAIEAAERAAADAAAAAEAFKATVEEAGARSAARSGDMNALRAMRDRLEAELARLGNHSLL